MCACVAVQVHVPALVLPTSLRASSWPLPNRIRSQHQDVVPSVGLCRLPELRTKGPFFFGCAAWGDAPSYHTFSVWCGLRRGTGSLCPLSICPGQAAARVDDDERASPGSLSAGGRSNHPSTHNKGCRSLAERHDTQAPLLPLMVAHYEEPFAACTNNLRHCGSVPPWWTAVAL